MKNVVVPAPSSLRRRDDTATSKTSSSTTNCNLAKVVPLIPPLESYEPGTMTRSLFFYWVVPVFLLALVSRFTVDTSVGSIDVSNSNKRPITIELEKDVSSHSSHDERRQRHRQQEQQQQIQEKQQKNKQQKHGQTTKSQKSLDISQMPTSYRELVQGIQKRRRKIFPGHSILSLPDEQMQQILSTSSSSMGEENDTKTRSSTSSSSTRHDDASSSYSHRSNSRNRIAPSPSPSSSQDARGPTSDPQRIKSLDRIDRLRQQHQDDPDDLFLALEFADALRLYDIQYHDGGTFEEEAIEMYQRCVDMAMKRKESVLEAGEPTTQPNIGSGTGILQFSDEVTLDYPDKSADGLLCAIYTAQGKVYYMANWFERAVDSYNNCLNAINEYYLDARNSRGSALIILGRYEEAANDFMTVIQFDHQRYFTDAFVGLSRLLGTNDTVIEKGWDRVVEPLKNTLIPHFDDLLLQRPQAKHAISTSLSRFHHVLFTYHDTKTKQYDDAWDHLTKAYEHKLSILSPWREGLERHKAVQTMSIFREGFWQLGLGSATETPIFIIGFVRSGSTLLERVLDAHPLIVGTGENSVFNGHLDEIRNKIVEVSVSPTERHTLGDVTKEMADNVVTEMKHRWQVLDANTNWHKDEDQQEDPKRLVDKMLTNYYNVGFIHMLYPKALILHVAREPMDTLFSAYKHEFPPGTLDYTSDFTGLAELYITYRELMDHWDKVLPGRVTHVRYEDMVHDMPGMAKAIIHATGLPWDESVLDFHKKKHAVNTLSTTQVRKGVYKDALQSWKKYERQLQPLMKKIGDDRVSYNLRTSLPSYIAPMFQQLADGYIANRQTITR